MKSFLFTLAALFLAVSVASAEAPLNISKINLPSLSPEKTQPADLGEKFKSLLGSGQLSFKNTVGFNFRSGAFGGASQYYMNTITYQAKSDKPLILQAQVGLENNFYGSSAFGSSRGGSTKLVVPYIGLFYQPRENMQIEIQFSNIPYYGSRGRYPY